jgi:hypothetical protein
MYTKAPLMLHDINEAIQAAETALATELRVLAATMAVAQSAADLSEGAAGYRRTHPIRSLLHDVPVSLRHAETSMLLPLLAMLDRASPDVRSALGPLLGGRSLSEPEALALRSIIVLDAALENYRALANVIEEDHPLAGQWASTLRAADDAHGIRVSRSRRVRRFSSPGVGLAVVAGFLVGTGHLLLTMTSSYTPPRDWARSASS